jgi:hypothetical protein
MMLKEVLAKSGYNSRKPEIGASTPEETSSTRGFRLGKGKKSEIAHITHTLCLLFLF